MTSPTNGPFLPLDVVFNILSHLPVKSLLRFKSVCRSWLRLISDRRFVAAHLEQSKKHPHLLLVASKRDKPDTLFCYDEEHQYRAPLLQVERWHRLSPHHCDGLVLLFSEMNIFVCNPCTRELVCLHRSHLSEIRPGFGLDPLSNRYKVVRLFYSSSTTVNCEVFTLGSSDRRWRTVGCFPDCWVVDVRETATVDGVVYWFSDPPQQEHWQLLAFDLRDESFRLIQIPHLLEYDEWCRFFLINHEGYLCLIVMSWHTPHKEVWVLSRHDNRWSKRYSFEFEEIRYYFMCPVPVMLSGERILFGRPGLYLYEYDMRNRRSRTIAVDDDDAGYVNGYAIYAESLVSVGLGPAIDEN